MAARRPPRRPDCGDFAAAASCWSITGRPRGQPGTELEHARGNPARRHRARAAAGLPFSKQKLTMLLLSLWAGAAMVQAPAACPTNAPSVQASGVPWDGAFWTACDHTVPGGDVVFVEEVAAAGCTITVGRRAERLYRNESDCWLNYTKAQVQATVADVMGNALLARGNPSLAVMRRAIPPMVMSAPDSIKGDPPTGTAHTFVGSRGSVTNLAFVSTESPAPQSPPPTHFHGTSLTDCFWLQDVHGADINGMGHPSMGSIPNKYKRTAATFKDKLDSSGQLEGLWGGYLPITSNYFKLAGPPAPPPAVCHQHCHHSPKLCCDPAPPDAGDTGYIEMTVVPVADMEGNMEQAAWFRMQKTNANGTVLAARYFDTFAYTAGAFQTPEQVPASGEPAGAQSPLSTTCGAASLNHCPLQARPQRLRSTRRCWSNNAGGQTSWRQKKE